MAAHTTAWKKGTAFCLLAFNADESISGFAVAAVDVDEDEDEDVILC